MTYKPCRSQYQPIIKTHTLMRYSRKLIVKLITIVSHDPIPYISSIIYMFTFWNKIYSIIYMSDMFTFWNKKISRPNNVVISGALFTLSVSKIMLNSQGKEGARYVNIVWSRYFIKMTWILIRTATSQQNYLLVNYKIRIFRNFAFFTQKDHLFMTAVLTVLWSFLVKNAKFLKNAELELTRKLFV